MNGKVKFFNTAKGFGFVTPDEGGKDVFVHATALEAAGISALNEGDRVSFVLEDDRKGRGKQAGQLKIFALTGVVIPLSRAQEDAIVARAIAEHEMRSP